MAERSSHRPPAAGETAPAGPDRLGRQLLRAAGWLGDNCEHREHLEEPRWPIPVIAGCLLETAAQMAQQSGRSLRCAYVERIRLSESESMLRFVAADRVDLAGFERLAVATTWAEFQIGQLVHDRQFHPDVFGTSRYDQLRHHSFALAALPGAWYKAAQSGQVDDFYDQHLPDVAIFGVRLASLINLKLPDGPVDEGFDPQSAGIIV